MAPLNLKDREFLEKLSNIFDLTPERLYTSKTLYNSLAQKISKEDTLLWQEYKTLQRKLGFEPLIPTIPNTTQEIVDIQKADFHCHQVVLPLKFVKNTSQYQLWKDPTHRFETIFKDQPIKYTITLNKLSVLLVETNIIDLLHYPEAIYVKTAHTDKIFYKSDRKTPRIATDIPCFVKRANLLCKATMNNLSSKGCAITIEGEALELLEKIELHFPDWICKELKGVVTRKDKCREPKNVSYAIEFHSTPALTQQKIDSFIYQHCQEPR